MRSHGVSRRPDFLYEHDGPWYYEMDELSFNCRMTDFQCALGLSQLKKLDSFKERREAIFDAYHRAFSTSDKLILPPNPSNQSVCHHLYTLQFTEGAKTRNLVFDILKSFKIHCQVHYIPIYHQPYYKQLYNYPFERFYNSEIYYSRCLTLPMYPGLDESVVQFVIDVILTVVNQR